MIFQVENYSMLNVKTDILVTYMMKYEVNLSLHRVQLFIHVLLLSINNYFDHDAHLLLLFFTFVNE
jgi:hypothetical protein